MFETFVDRHEPRLRAGLVAAYGPQIGAEACADAMAYAWEHWDRLQAMDNPAGYLYRVGQSAARRYHRPDAYLPTEPPTGLPDFEPSLVPALQSLTEPQRVGVIMVHALGWTQADAAELLDVEISTLRTHVARGMTKLRTALQVDSHAN